MSHGARARVCVCVAVGCVGAGMELKDAWNRSQNNGDVVVRDKAQIVVIAAARLGELGPADSIRAVQQQTRHRTDEA